MHQASRFLALFLLALALVGPAAPANAQVGTACDPGQSPRYVFGFADLKRQLGEWMGDPLTCEFPDPNGTGDVHQRTSRGLAFWRKSTNTPTFTNGYQHWGLDAGRLVYWTGDGIDPPVVAMAGAVVASGAFCTSDGSCSAAPLPLPPVEVPPASPAAPQPNSPTPTPSPRPSPTFTPVPTATATRLPSPSPTQPPAYVGPFLLGVAPQSCGWGLVGTARVFLCLYPGGAAAAWDGESPSATLLAFRSGIPGSEWAFTDAGRRAFGLTPSGPPAPAPGSGGSFTLREIDGHASLLAQDGRYLGLVSSSTVATDSICNSVGFYGSTVSTTSVRNTVSLYGSSVSALSAYNSVTSTPPRILYNGAAVGYLTKNSVLPGAVDPDALFAVYGCTH